MNTTILGLSVVSLSVALSTTCVSSGQKPFDQMTAQEHRAAAAREHQLADDNLERVSGDNITPPETLYSDGYYYEHAESGAYGDSYPYELSDPEAYTAWPRIGDPSEKYEDAAAKHRENALRHERQAALLEGRPSPQPLPPPEQHPLLPGPG